MLTHDNIYSNVMAAKAAIPFAGDDTCLSFLPLSHIFERMGGHYMMLATGTSIAYAESIDTVPLNMTEVRPTLVLSVPRLYEKMYARVLENALSGGAVKKRIFFWARERRRPVGRRRAGRRHAARAARAAVRASRRRFVFSKLQARTGGRLRYFVSGGAPLAPEINKFFYAAGLVILEGYGLTETSPVISREHAGELPHRHGRQADRRRRGDDRRATARSSRAARTSCRATSTSRRRPRKRSTPTAGSTPATSASCATDSSPSPTARRTSSSPPAARTSRRSRSRTRQDEQVRQPGRDDRRQAQIPDHARRAELGHAREVGDARRTFLDATARNCSRCRPSRSQDGEGSAWARSTGSAHFEMPKKIGLLEHDFSIERGELTPTLKVKRRVVDKTTSR